MTNTRTLITRLVAALVLASPALAVAAARAELPRGNQLAVDVPAQLVVTVDGTADRAPAPRLPNADVTYSGQMSSSTITNGRAAMQTSFVYTIVPRKAGPLTIPPIAVGGDTTRALQATVTTAPPARTSANPHGLSTGPRGQAPARATREPVRAFMRIDVPSRALYVGEAVPVKIRAYFRGGTAATLNAAPTIRSEAFTLSDLSDTPAQSEIEIDGIPYLQVTWTGVLSPAKPTTDRVTVELPVEIAYREMREVQRPSMRDLLGSDPFGADLDALFDDPFFSDPFGGMDTMFDVGTVRRQALTLRHDVGRARIAEVPDAGKPAGYTGAVGQFQLTSEPPKDPLRVGEPATLTFRVSGTGNFDRVSLAGMTASADWKVYPGTTSVEPSKESPVRATKIVTQTIVPTRAGELDVPAVTFSFFDPKAKAYRTVSTEAFTASVTPAAAGGGTDPDLTSSSVLDSAMTANRVQRGATRTTLVPWVHRDGVWLVPAALLASTLLVAGVGLARRSETLLQRRNARRVDRAVSIEHRRLAAAASEQDPARFFAAARRALQLRLAATWGVAPETITAADVVSRLGEDGNAIRDVFEQADGLTYAHGLAAPDALDRWHAVVDQQLASLKGAR